MRAWKGQRWTSTRALAEFIDANRTVAEPGKAEPIKRAVICRTLNRWEPKWRSILERNKYGV